MSQNYIYTAQSVQTRYWITSTEGDVAGQIVATANGTSGPNLISLTFNKVLDPSGITTDVTIKGASGLYIALPENATSGSKLVWSNDATNWQVDNTSGVYEIFPADGQDLYWMTDEATGPTVEVRKGSEVIEKENEWILTRASA
ncbi:uncharacterized protein ARMOST_16468 [Armillaria ostoyae]|uniref:Ricin B lectin domain-containing protein n=1 Tax=Armillaria ostoyae TaxID=47428 RepID=A0A284RWB4_ARMOS|nr:uncharacterized protein ARMOST_16467 [Armillaria ostoyae]SJL13032.1 uncharacterized protein ARMOST_16468 [Armillaria ostoyae]